MSPLKETGVIPHPPCSLHRLVNVSALIISVIQDPGNAQKLH